MSSRDSQTRLDRELSDSSNEMKPRDANEAAADHLGSMKVFAIISLALCFTGSQISGFLVGPGINFIADDLHIGTERSWIVVSYGLTAACVAPCAGYLQDLIGRRGSLAFGLVCTIIGNIVSGTTNGFAQGVAGSAVAGIGSAIQELTAVAAVAELVPAKKRGLFQALNIGTSVAFAPAVLYAQLLHSNWRWLFWIPLIWNCMTASLLCLSYFRLHVDRKSRPLGKITFWQIDWIGIVLLTISLTIFLVGLQSGGDTHPWDSAYVLVQLIVGLATFCFFLLWESRNIGKPLVPFRLFHGQRVVGLALGIGAMGGVIFYTTLNLGPTIIQVAFDETTVGYGLLALGPGLGLIFGAVTTNVMLSVIGERAREVLFVGTVVMTAFTGAEAALNPNDPNTFAVLSSFAALGVGSVLIPMTTLATLACPEDLIGTAVALTLTVRSVGGSVGYAILYSIYLSRSSTTVKDQMMPRLLKAGLSEASVGTFIKRYVNAVAGGNLQDIPHASVGILDAADQGFRAGMSQAARLVYYVAVAFAATAVLLALCLPNMQQYLTDKVLAQTSSPQDLQQKRHMESSEGPIEERQSLVLEETES